MSIHVARAAATVFVGLLASAGCAGDTPAADPASTAPAESNPEVPAASSTALSPQPDPLWGMPVPAGARADGRAPGVAHWRIRAPWDELTAFYDAQLPGWTRHDFERGARYEAPDSAPEAIYLYRDRVDGSWVVSYFEVDGAEAPASSTLADRRPEASGSGAASAGAAGAAGANAATGSAAGGGAVAGAGGGTSLGSSASGASASGAGVAGGARTGPGNLAQGSASAPGARNGSETAASDASAGRAGAAARTYRSSLNGRIGAPVAGGQANGPAPLVPPTSTTPAGVHPRLQDHVQANGQQRQVRFVRGVREPRRNPGAMF